MILEINEQEYRKMPLLNKSELTDLIKDPRVYQAKWINKDNTIQKKDRAAKKTNEKMIYGQLVDTLLTSPLEFDFDFLITRATIPTAQTLIFTQSLYKHTLAYTDEAGILTVDMDFLYDLAWKDSGASKLDTIKKKFVESGLEYYTELRNANDRLVISQETYEKAERLIEKLRNHPYSAGLINLETNERFTVKDQLVLTGEIEGLEMKGKLDRLIVDEKNKTIHLWDYKVNDGEKAFAYNYTELYYYLQQLIYTLLARQNYPDYEVKPLSMLSVDRTLYQAPIKYKGSEKNLEQAMHGFKKEGRKYVGLLEAIDDYKYYHKHNCYETGRKAHESNGNLDIEIFEDLKKNI